ncbi:MAG: hypothetical protein CMJ28_00575 [Phycisphaerae bacterium]|nr:hypothetical protein [Phycisphaerae bacterium]
MLISTPLSLFMALASLNGPDDLSIERKFSAVLVQNGMRLEVEGSGPEAFFVEIDGSRLPKELTRWQDGTLEILNEDGEVVLQFPLAIGGGEMAEMAPRRPKDQAKPKSEFPAVPGFMGIEMTPVESLPPMLERNEQWDIDPTRCTKVASIVPDSPAARAGLRTGDIIVPQTERSADPKTLARTIASMQPGTVVSAVVIRDGKKITIEVELGARLEFTTDDRRMMELRDRAAQMQRMMGDLERQIQNRMQKFEHEQVMPFMRDAQQRLEKSMQRSHSGMEFERWELDMNLLMRQFEFEIKRRFEQLEKEFRPWAAEVGNRLEQQLQRWGEDIGEWSDELRYKEDPRATEPNNQDL